MQRMIHISTELNLLTSFIVSAILSAILSFFDYYANLLVEHHVFIKLIFSAFVCDVILGAWKHFKARDFSFKELFTKAVTKIAVVLLAMILFNSMAGLQGMEESGIQLWLLLVGKLLSVIYFTGSAFNSMYFITDHKFPPYAWISRMQTFNKTLDTREFTNKDVDDSDVNENEDNI
jgi:hypothetical protein